MAGHKFLCKVCPVGIFPFPGKKTRAHTGEQGPVRKEKSARK